MYPTNVSELRSYRGACNVFRSLVPNFARTSAPLNEKLEKGASTVLRERAVEEKEAVPTLKEKLIASSIMALSRGHGDLIFEIDACDEQLGEVLIQEQPKGLPKPTAHSTRPTVCI